MNIIRDIKLKSIQILDTETDSNIVYGGAILKLYIPAGYTGSLAIKGLLSEVGDDIVVQDSELSGEYTIAVADSAMIVELPTRFSGIPILRVVATPAVSEDLDMILMVMA